MRCGAGWLVFMVTVVVGCTVGVSSAEAPPDAARLARPMPEPAYESPDVEIAGYSPEEPMFKRYPEAALFELPRPAAPATPLFETLRTRRSRRRYAAGGLTLEELSHLLWAASGVTARRWGIPLRTAPSGGALYPIEVYVVVHDVEGLEPGIYHLAVEPFVLERLREGDWRAECAWSSMNQTGRNHEGCVIVMTQVVRRITQRYGERGERYGWQEMGAMMQNVLLAVESLGLSTVPIGAFHDDRVGRILGIDHQREVPGLMLPVGRRVAQ